MNEYDKIKEEVKEDMKSCLIGFMLSNEKQENIAKESYLIGELVRAKLKIKDQKRIINELRFGKK